LNGKIYFQPNQKDRFSLTVYQGQDRYLDKTDFIYEDESFTIYDSTRYDVNWKNQLAVFKWNHLYNEKLFSNLTLSYTENKYQSSYASKYYEFEVGFEEFQQSNVVQFFSNVKDFGAELDFDFFPNENHHVSFGIGHHRISSRPGVGRDSLESSLGGMSDDPFENYFDDLLDNSYLSDETHIYLHDNWKLRKNLSLNIGGRFSQFASKNLIFDENSNHQTWQANASLRWLISKNISTTFSFDKTTQTVHLLSSSNIGFPNDLWLPSIENILPSEAMQFNWGLTWNANSNLRIGSNFYYKKMDNLLKFKELSSIPSLFDFLSDFWESEVTNGNGTSKGFEVKADYQQSQFKTSIAYTLSKTDRQFEDFNNDEKFPFEFDQRHKLTIQFFQKIKNELWWYANWNFYNGLHQTLYLSEGPFTPLDNYFPPPDIRLSSVNGDQLSDYHRLDIGLVWRREKTSFSQEFNLGVQNVYNRKNTFFQYQEEDPFFPDANGLKKSQALPLLPFIMYKIRIGKN